MPESEYCKLEKQFPSISFSDKDEKRNKSHSLLQLECQAIIPRNYQKEIVCQYKQCYTWSTLVHKANLSIGVKSVRIGGFPLLDNYHWLDSFPTVEQRKHGVCLITRYQPSAAKRIEVFNNLEIEKHCYGKIPYCTPYYQGVIGETEQDTWPSSLAKLKVLSQYKFCLCFENCFVDPWASDYLTEKIFDCFKSKTIPIYYGATNVQEHIPEDLYIDYRKFKSDSELTEYLHFFSNEDFNKTTEKAFNWVKQSRYGNAEDLVRIFKANE